MEGHLDVCTVSRISGWAAAGDEPAELDVIVNGTYVARIACHQPRSDIEAHGLPANTGFSFVFPFPIAPSCRVSVKFPDGTHVQGSPRLPQRHEGRLAICSVVRVTGRAMWDGKPAAVDILVNDERVGRIQSDDSRPPQEEQANIQPGCFAFIFPHRLAPSDRVSAIFPDGTHLNGSPRHPSRRDGQLEHCTVSEIRGWAIDETPQTDLSVLVNNLHFASIQCGAPRVDLGPEDNPRFSYQFPYPLAVSDKVAVRWPGGPHLANSPRNPMPLPADTSQRRPAAAQRRHITIVVGMHRSGTSLCSNVLSTLGLDMSDDVQVAPSNERGHWERPEIVAFHDRILRAFNRDWFDDRHALGLPPHWWTLPLVRGIRDEMVQWLRGRERIRHFGFKDPRTARLLPLWDGICCELSLSPRYVFCVRDPAQVARSLAARDGMATRHGEYRWMVYNSHAVQALGRRPVCIIPYDQWFSEEQENFARLTAWLGLDSALAVRAIAARAIEPRLRHDDEANAPAPAVSLATVLYRHIRDSARGDCLTPQTVDAAGAFIAVEEFMQPLLIASIAPGSSLPEAPPASVPAPAAVSRFAKPQITLAEGLANTIGRYSDALRTLLQELAQEGTDPDNPST